MILNSLFGGFSVPALIRSKKMKTVTITGASGFVGTFLCERLLSEGYRVTGIGRSSGHPFVDSYENFSWVSADTVYKGEWQKSAAASDAIVNLAGRNIFGRWTGSVKNEIYRSRVETTRHIVEAVDPGAPAKLINASAVGYYGDRGDEILTEDNAPGRGFLADVCVNWEKEAFKAEAKSARVAVMRFGVVLGRGGALSKMLPAFKSGFGGPLAGGKHWMAWIHIADLVAGVKFLLENETLSGAFNFSAPGIVRQKEFAAELGRLLNRPAFVPTPGLLLRLVAGELGSALTQSQRAIPQRLEQEGFAFDFPDPAKALSDILPSREKRSG